MMPDQLRTLYPDVEPYERGMLAVSDLHTLYYEQCGNPDGKPVVFLHGGPGAGCNEKCRRFFDPKHYRIVLFDQRGSGRSTPRAELRDNTTWDLVADIERVRDHLKIDRWQVFGGSWGSTLALTYAETHPDRVTELVLRGIFLSRRWENEWFYQKGCDALYPDAFEPYVAMIPENERGDMIAAYYERLTSEDKAVQLSAAKAWSAWEGATSHLLQNADYIASTGTDEFALAAARIETHYFVNGGFFDGDDQLLRNVDKIRRIPGVIVQGRYDVSCPLRSAWDLHRAWPEAELRIVADAGHSAFETGITDELVRATDKFRRE
jgi:proline iminopeptidase